MLSTLMGLLMMLGVGQPEVVYAQEVLEPKIILVEAESEEQRIIRRIKETFPEEPNIAVAVAKGESELDPNAFNPEAHKSCRGSIGVMQIACVHRISDIQSLHDVDTNLAVARRVYDEAKRSKGNGWLPWGSYTDGRYKQYLD